MVKKLKRLTLKKQAENALREMIASYRFTPGKWINVESLAKELEVSRTPVWQALKDLEKEGLVPIQNTEVLVKPATHLIGK